MSSHNTMPALVSVHSMRAVQSMNSKPSTCRTTTRNIDPQHCNVVIRTTSTRTMQLTFGCNFLPLDTFFVGNKTILRRRTE
jgi:hypothetical protein